MPRHIPGTEYSKPIDPQKLAVGQRIAQKRNELGLSQAELGALIRTPHKPQGLTAGAIGLYERGMSFPEMEHFDQLPSILGCTREWLLTGSEKRSERARALDAQEFALLEAFRRQKPDTKVAVVQMLQGGRGRHRVHTSRVGRGESKAVLQRCVGGTQSRNARKGERIELRGTGCGGSESHIAGTG